MLNKNQPVQKGSPGMLSFVKVLMLLILFSTSVSWKSVGQSVVLPQRYYTFNGSNFGADSMGGQSINFAYYQSQYAVDNTSGVGKAMEFTTSTNTMDCGTLPLTNAVTVEFLFKPGYNFQLTNLIRRNDGAFTVMFDFPKMTFTTIHTSSSGSVIEDQFTIEMNGLGRKSWGYYVDGNWHHMVFTFNASTGVKQIWVDGQSPQGFSKTITTGTFSNTGTTNFSIGHLINYIKYFGSMDEIAVYNTVIPPSLIYKHYLNFQNGQSYSFTNDYTGSLPTPSAITGPLDMLEFAPGHPNVTMMATDQIQRFPVPRYKPGNTLIKNFNWMDPKYMGGLSQPYVTNNQQAANNGALIQTELAKNFNYFLHLEFGNTEFANAYVAVANANPDFKLSVVTFRGQGPDLKSLTKPNDHYLQNSSGEFLDIWGNVTTSKIWRPTAPISSYVGDGTYKYNQFNDLLGRLTRGIDWINENGEIFPHITEAAMVKDPVVTAAKNASGLDWKTFLATKFMENETQSYRNQFMSHPKLANAKFTEYGIGGEPNYQPFKYSVARQVNSMINGQYYSTTDFYTRYPHNWRNWTSAWHGWQWIVDSRYHELALGDRLYSPFVSPGWDSNEENNIRPAQWLGLMKVLGMTGAEFYYTCFFSGTAPFPDSRNWVWQASIPSYAQAITSRYEDYIRNGELMNGDVANNYITPTRPGYSFWTGDHRKLVVIRKHNVGNKYAITGTIQPQSNMAGNTENESVATIKLDNQTIKFKVRRQGSTYIYDKTNAASPVFYQLDDWHEKTHPLHWTTDFKFQAELFDNNTASAVIKTMVPAGTPAGDFTNHTSYVTFTSNVELVYNFHPRTGTPTTQYLWVRARSRTGSSTGFSVKVNTGTAQLVDCITDTNWVWYRINTNNTAVLFSGLTVANQQLKITPLNTNLEIDQIHLSGSSSALYASVGNQCTATAQAVITPSGPTTFCQGGNVSLSANSGNSYLWSTGATSQSISVSSSGSYTVTVTTNGVAVVSSPVTVTVNSLPTATISASGSTSLCSGSSVTLTASSGTSYLWSPGGQTTQSVTVSTAGTYRVTVTNSSGCSKTSSDVNVTVTSCTTCAMPTGLVTGNVTSNTAVVQWTNPNSGQTDFQVRYRNMRNGWYYYSQKVPATTTSLTISVNSSTSYRWWVRSYCNTLVSSYAGYLTFTTPSFLRHNPSSDPDFEAPAQVFMDEDSNEPARMIEFDLYAAQLLPNPADEATTLSVWAEHQDQIQILVSDINGKVVHSEKRDLQEGLNLHEIQTTHLKRGLYLVQLKGNMISKNLRLVLQ